MQDENDFDEAIENIEVENEISYKDPSIVCIIHDSVHCFSELNENILDTDNRFGEFYIEAKNWNSECILKFLEKQEMPNFDYESNSNF